MKACRLIEVFLARLAIFISMSQFCICCHADPLNSWNLVLSNNPASGDSMAYGNGTFVGYGGGLGLISHDGSNWTIYASPPTITQGGVAYGNGIFLAFGTNTQFNANYILQSTNGITWTPIYTSSNTLFTAAYGNNTWVFLGNNEIVTANVTSTNWIWSDYQPSFTPTSITYGNGVFVTVGGNWILSSHDGITWQFDSIPINSFYTDNLGGIAYGNGLFVVAGYVDPSHSIGPEVLVSSNLLNWTLTLTNTAFYIFFGGNKFIATPPYPNYGGTTYFYSSSDGYIWVTNNTIANIGNSTTLTYGQGTFVADAGNIYQSGAFTTDSNSPTPTTLGISTYPGVTINGMAGAVYQIQSTTNLNSSWQSLTNFMLPFSPYIWVDTSSTISGQKFYRSVQLQ